MTLISRSFAMFIIALIALPFLAFAQEAESQDATADMSAPQMCLDIFNFQTINIGMDSDVVQAISGTETSFSGTLENTSEYPVANATLFAKVVKAEGNTDVGDMVLDQFVIADDISLLSGETLEIDHIWNVPANTQSGDYAIFYTMTMHEQPLAGLVYTDILHGDVAQFSVVGESGSDAPLSFDRTQTLINGVQNDFFTDVQEFDINAPTVVSTVVVNPTDQAKTIPLQWTQYAGEIPYEENSVHTNTKLITLEPNERKEVEYTVRPQQSTRGLLTATLYDYGVQSVLNIPFVQEGLNDSRIVFTGVSDYPLTNSEATIAACAVFGENTAPNGEVRLTVTDGAGTELHTSVQAITEAVSLVTADFTASAQNVVVTAELVERGTVVDTVQSVYSCESFNGVECPVGSGEVTVFSDTQISISEMIMMTVGIVVLVLILIVLFVLFRKKGVSTTMGIFIVAAAFAGSTAFVQAAPPSVNIAADDPNITSGQSTTLRWNTSGAGSCSIDGNSVSVNGLQSVSPTTNTTYTLSCMETIPDCSTAYDSTSCGNVDPSCAWMNIACGFPNMGSGSGCGWCMYLGTYDTAQDTATVNVSAPVVNTNPNTPTITGSGGSVGTNLSFTINGTDPDNDTVFYQYEWDNSGVISNTGTVNSGISQSVTRSWSTTGTKTLRARTVDSRGGTSGWRTHSFGITAVTAPGTISGSGCQITAGNNSCVGTVTWDSNASCTYVFNHGTGAELAGGASAATNQSANMRYGMNRIALIENCLTAPINYYTEASVDDAYITTTCASGTSWNGSICAVTASPNSAPSAPNITGNANGTTGVAGPNLNFVATDPDGDSIQYEVNFGDGIVVTLPQFAAPPYVSSGIAQTYSHTWTSAGLYTVTAYAIDDQGARSAAATYDVSISNPTPTTCSFSNVQACVGSSCFGGTNIASVPGMNPPANFASYTVDVTAGGVTQTITESCSGTSVGGWQPGDPIPVSDGPVEIFCSQSNTYTVNGVNFDLGITGVRQIDAYYSPGVNQGLGSMLGCSGAVTPPPAYATISGTACTIAAGASTCTGTATWDIQNATTPNVRNNTAGSQISTNAAGNSVSVTYQYGTNMLSARDSGSELATHPVNVSCASGSSWNGGSCATATPPVCGVWNYTTNTVPNDCSMVLGPDCSTLSPSIDSTDDGQPASGAPFRCLLSCTYNPATLSSFVEEMSHTPCLGSTCTLEQTVLGNGTNSFECGPQPSYPVSCDPSYSVGDVVPESMLEDHSIGGKSCYDYTSGPSNGPCTHYALSCTGTSVPPPPVINDFNINGNTADFAVPTTAGPLTVTWNAANTSCTLIGAGTANGSVSNTGSVTFPVSTITNPSELYRLSCEGGTLVRDINVSVTNAAPVLNPITVVTTGDSVTDYDFIFNATDADGDQVYYQVDWGDGSLLWNTPYTNEGVNRAASHRYPAGSYTLTVTANDGTNTSAPQTLPLTVANIPPANITEFQVSERTSATWDNGPVYTINPGDKVDVRWNSSDATRCYGNLFDTSDATQNLTGIEIPEGNLPAMGASDTYTLTCEGAGGNDSQTITIAVNDLPDLTNARIDANPSGFDSATGIYSTFTVEIGVSNYGTANITGGIPYEVSIDVNGNGSYADAVDLVQTGTYSPLTAGADGAIEFETFNSVPIFNGNIRVEFDHNDTIREVNDAVADNTMEIPFILSPLDPNMTLTPDRTLVRDGDTVTLNWNTNATYPMQCDLSGPVIISQTPANTFDPNVDGTNGSASASPITAKSEYLLSCTETITGTTFTATTIVEVVPDVREI